MRLEFGVYTHSQESVTTTLLDDHVSESSHHYILVIVHEQNLHGSKLDWSTLCLLRPAGVLEMGLKNIICFIFTFAIGGINGVKRLITLPLSTQDNER
jgi:hypothetical protein